MTKYVFRGFDNPSVAEKEVWYGDGRFVVGEIYERVSEIDYPETEDADAVFIDADGQRVYEEIVFFDEVIED